MNIRTFFRQLRTDDSIRQIKASTKKYGKSIVSDYLDSIIIKFDVNIVAISSKEALYKLFVTHVNRDTVSSITLKEILNALDKIIPAFLENLASQKKLMTDIRKHIANEYGDDSEIYHLSYTLMRVNQELMRKIKDDYNRRIEEHNSNKTEVKYSHVLTAIDKGLVSKNWADNMVALILSTGARVTEAMLMSKFEEAESPNYIKQIGVSKQKDNEFKIDHVIKPLIKINFGELNDLINQIRRHFANEIEDIENGLTTAYIISSSRNILITNAIKRLMPDLKHGTSHTLRKIYAIMSYENYADKVKFSQQAWFAKVLGHSTLNIAKSYSVIGLIRDDIKPKADIFINPRLRDGKVMEYITKTAEDMKKYNIDINCKNLMKYKYGKSTAIKYLNIIKNNDIAS